MGEGAGTLRGRFGALIGWQDGLAARGRVVGSTVNVDGGTKQSVLLSIAGREVAGILLLPDRTPCPAVLYCHAHGGNYTQGAEELLSGAPYLSGPYARDLRYAGFAVLAVDMPGFGSRQAEGNESAIAKAALWRGGSMFADMLKCQAAALGYLASRPEVDAERIAALGMSMGAALAFWLGAMDSRVGAVAGLCMLADIEDLIRLGVHDRHGIYLAVPGLLSAGDMGDVAGLVAPRPQFIGHERGDHLTPTAARDTALLKVRAAYRTTGAADALECFMGNGEGHVESPGMRAAALAFLQRWVVGKRDP